MDLRKKMLLALVGIMVIILIGGTIITITLLYSSAQNLQDTHVRQVTGLVKSTILLENTDLGSIVLDWGSCDDTWSFAGGQNDEYPERNFQKDRFNNTPLDFIIIINPAGDLVYSRGYDPEKRELVPVQNSLISAIENPESPFRSANVSHPVSGFLSLPEVPVVLASSPILQSNSSGPVRGWIIIGRNLDKEEISRLLSGTLSSVTIESLRGYHLPQNPRGANGNMSESIYVQPENPGSITGYAVLKDIYGNDALLLKVPLSADIFEENVNNASLFRYLQLAAGLIVGLFFIALLDLGVLSRLSILSSDINTITAEENPTAHVTVSGDDEISRLAEAMNRMLSQIQKNSTSLVESEKRFHDLAEQFPEIMIEMDDRRNITFANRIACEILGYSEDDLQREQRLGEIFVPEDRARAQECFARVFKGEISRGEIFTIQKTDGSRIPVIVYTAPVIRHEKRTGVRIFAGDISERKRIEDELRDVNEKLNLMNNITRHDLLNQLTILFGYIELAEQSNKDPVMNEKLKIMKKAGKTIEEQIKFTRDYQDIGVRAPRWQNVHDTIHKATANIDLHNVNLSVDVPDWEVYADGLLEKVFYNLVENAVKYGKKITNIRFSCHKTPEALVLVCEDDGIGIPDDAKEKIFNRQYFTHTGFGMFLSKEILAITGLSIKEAGSFGNGARFEILVPQGSYRPATRK